MKKSFHSWSECVTTRELQSLKSLQHPQIVQLLEIIRESNQNVYFVFEYMPDGNLYEFLKRHTPHKTDPPGFQRPKLDHSKIQSLTKQVVQGLAYLHARGFVHRDIKPENLLIRGDTIKIADFNLARTVTVSSSEAMTEYVSTRWYRAPEVCLRAPVYGPPVDLFAVGCIIAELYIRLPLFPAESEISLVYSWIKVLGVPDENTWPEGVRLANKAGYSFAAMADEQYGAGEEPTPLESKVRMASSRAIHFMTSLLQWNPDHRPSANQALQDPYFSPISTISPKPTATAELTDSLVKKRSLAKLVTAYSPGHFYTEDDDGTRSASLQSSNTWDDLSPLPLERTEKHSVGNKRPRQEQSSFDPPGGQGHHFGFDQQVHSSWLM